MVNDGGPQPARYTQDQTWRALQRLADSHTPGVRRRFLAAVRELRAGIPLAELEAALLRRDTEALMQLLPWDDYAAALAQIPEAMATAAAAAHPVTVRAAVATLAAAGEPAVLAALELTAGSGAAQSTSLGIRFDLTSPHVREAIAQRAGARITEVAAETQRAVRDVVQRSYDAGVHPRQAAREIQRLVGLTRRQADSVGKLRAALEHPKEGAPKLTQKQVDRRVDQYAARLVKERAETIARTESITAMAEGAQAGWEDLVAQGMLDPAAWEQEWLAVMQPERTCKRCLAMDGKKAPIGGMFEEEGHGPVKGPGLHPRCRCSVVLVRHARK